MNNFELHEQAQALADNNGAYGLARKLVALREEYNDVVKERDHLRERLSSLGVCPECLEERVHHIYEPFSSCSCTTEEDYGKRFLQKDQLRDMGFGETKEDFSDVIDYLKLQVEVIASSHKSPVTGIVHSVEVVEEINSVLGMIEKLEGIKKSTKEEV